MSAASRAPPASVAEEAGVVPASDAGGGEAGSGGGERSSSSSSSSTASPPNQQRRPLRTLEDVVRAPSSSLPDVVVLEALPEGLNRKEQVLDPKEDLWLTTADGRYNSPIIPLRVGQHPDTVTFGVHRDILTKYEYFETALCGGFLESRDQALHFPDDDPGIFHFLIAYIYEGRYHPIQPVSSVLIPDPDKGKGKDTSTSSSSDGESATSLGSDISAQSRRRRERRRRADRHFERLRQKHPGSHRPGCGCPTCQSAGANGGGPPCWACAAPRAPPPPQRLGHPPAGVMILDRDGNPTHHHNHHRPPGQRAVRPPPARRGAHNYPPPPMPFPNGAPMPMPPPPPPAGAGGQRMVGLMMPEGRIFGEDLRTWLLAYELNIDVYILANKFLMDGFKREVARTTIDMLETAGSDAAVPQVLRLCAKLKYGLSDCDPLLKMVFARVGFLQGLLWRREPEATEKFLVENPDVAAVMLRETVARREEDWGGRQLPSMERAWGPPGGGGGAYEFAGGYRGQAVPYGGYRLR